MHCRFSQKTNKWISFVCFFAFHGKQNKFVRLFFGRIYGPPKLLLVLSDLWWVANFLLFNLYTVLQSQFMINCDNATKIRTIIILWYLFQLGWHPLLLKSFSCKGGVISDLFPLSLKSKIGRNEPKIWFRFRFFFTNYSNNIKAWKYLD